jgi:hypothetical protein
LGDAFRFGIAPGTVLATIEPGLVFEVGPHDNVEATFGANQSAGGGFKVGGGCNVSTREMMDE